MCYKSSQQPEQLPDTAATTRFDKAFLPAPGGRAFPALVWVCFVTQIPFTFVVQVCTYRQSA